MMANVRVRKEQREETLEEINNLLDLCNERQVRDMFRKCSLEELFSIRDAVAEQLAQTRKDALAGAERDPYQANDDLAPEI